MIRNFLIKSITVSVVSLSLFGINYPSFSAEKPLEDRSEEFRKRINKQHSPWKTDFDLVAKQPKKFIQDFGNELESLDKQAHQNSNAQDSQNIRRRILEGYIGLGHFCRFKANQPNLAISFYQKADALGQKTPLYGFIMPELGAIRIADTYQYDLKDKANAIIYYQRALEIVTSEGKPNGQGPELINWRKGWLESELDFLKNGETFASFLQNESLLEFSFVKEAMREDMFRINLIIFDTGLSPGYDPRKSGSLSEKEREIIKQKLKNLPRSRFALASSIQALYSLQSQDIILAFLKFQDPEYYWSGSILGMALLDNVQQPLTSDKTQKVGSDPNSRKKFFLRIAEIFQAKTGVQLEMDLNQLQSGPVGPEEILKKFVSAMVRQDIETALSYFSLRQREEYRRMFESLKANGNDLSRMFSDATMACPKDIPDNSPYLECEALRDENGKTFSYPVAMVKDFDGKWRIERF